MEIGPRFAVEPLTDVGAGTLLSTHKRVINGKTFLFIYLKHPSGAATISVSEQVLTHDRVHNLYLRG